MWLALLALFTVVFGGSALGGEQNTTTSYQPTPSTAIKPWYRSQEEKDRAVRLGSVGWEDTDL